MENRLTLALVRSRPRQCFSWFRTWPNFGGLDRNTAARLTGNVPFEEATLLKLNCDKALAYLDWHSTLHYEECVHFIADWYKAFYTDANVDMYSLTTAQIDSYVRAAGAQHLKWAE